MYMFLVMGQEMISLDTILEADPEFAGFCRTRRFRIDQRRSVVMDKFAERIPERRECLSGHFKRIRNEIENG